MPRGRKEKPGGPKLDSLHLSDDFRMFCFKVLACSKHYCHDWTECPFSHPGEKARRRDPRAFAYVGIECPQMKETSACPRNELCPFAHNVFECWLHPTRYRTQLCNEPASCRRKVCFFAHTVEELREPTAGMEQVVDPTSAARIAASVNLTPSTKIDQQIGNHQVEESGPGNESHPFPPKPSRMSTDSTGSSWKSKQKPTNKRNSLDTSFNKPDRRPSGDVQANRLAPRLSADVPCQKAKQGSMDGKMPRSKAPKNRRSADIPRMLRQQQQQDQDSAAATVAQLQKLRNEIQLGQMAMSPADLSGVLEQLSMAGPSGQAVPLHQLQQFPQAGGLHAPQPPAADVTQNNKVVQLLMMVLKEITDSQAGQMVQPNAEMHARTSFDSSFSVGSGAPAGGSTSSGRLSMEGFVPMTYNMLNGTQYQDPNRGLYMGGPSGRVSLDGVPDFILHDSQRRDASIDSNYSDTFPAPKPRVSVDSGYESSVMSGGSSEHRSLSVDGGNAALKMNQMHNCPSLGESVSWPVPKMDPYAIRQYPDAPPGFAPATQPK